MFFFLKNIYTLGLENQYRQDFLDAIKFIQTLKKKNDSFYDPLIKKLTFPYRLIKGLKTLIFLF